MSGSIGANRIPRSAVETTLKLYIDKVLKNFPGFKSAKISGSYNTSVKPDHGDIDLVIHIEGDEQDRKKLKQNFASYISSLPDNITIPFKSGRHVGKKAAGTGDIVIVQFPIEGYPDLTVQIDNMIVASEQESNYRKSFLDLPAEKQGLLVGLAKAQLLEEDPKEIFKRLGINNVPKLDKNQEFEFNLSNKGLTLRLVTLGDNFKELGRNEIWTSFNWNDVEKLFQNYKLDGTWEDLLQDINSKLKNPRSKNRVKGIFKSLVVINAGEAGTPKGDNKLKALDTVNKLLENNYIKNLGEYLVASLLPEEFINSLPKQTIALYPGKFKPPHKGHLEAVKYALQKADKVIIIISPKSFEEYNDEQSKQIWELYEKTLGSDASKVEIKISKDPSPIKTAYEIIENDPVNNYMALYGKGELNRWKSLNNKEKYPNAEPLDLGSIENKNIEGTSEVISSTNLRQAIKDNDKDRIKTFLPYGVDIGQFLEIINKKDEENIEEIKINNPSLNFPLKVTKNNWDSIHKQLEAQGYTWSDGRKLSQFNPTRLWDKTYLGFYNLDYKIKKKLEWDTTNNYDSNGIWVNPLEEIKINKPRTISDKIEELEEIINDEIEELYNSGDEYTLDDEYVNIINSNESKSEIYKKLYNLAKHYNLLDNNSRLNEIKINNPNITPEKVWDYITIIQPILWENSEKYGQLIDKYQINPPISNGLKELPLEKLILFYNDLRKEFDSKINRNINEVGEGTSQPYETSFRYSDNEKFINFSTDSGIDYEISLFPINKFLQVDFHLDTFSNDIYQETNKGELFRIMSTVIKEVKEFLKENKDLGILGIRYIPQEKSKNKGAFLSSNQRNNFYKAFISKIVPGTTYVEQGGIVFAIFPKKENIQENMSNIKNQALYIDKLVKYCCDVLNLKERPKIILVNNNDYSQKYKSFGGYTPGEKKIFIVLKGRNLSDICRSLSHEMKHFEQDLKGVLTPESGQDGSEHENEANSFSGKIMREFNRKYPEILSISL